MRLRVLLPLFLAFLVFAGCTGGPQAQRQLGREDVFFSPSNVSVSAEAARTPEQLDAGLMFRTSLGEKDGMFFYMNYSAYHAFWMVNTKIPLEAIFLDDNFTVVDIIEMDPCSDPGTPTRASNCTIYLPKWPALYVLEVNQNFSSRYGIRDGDVARVS